MRYISNIGLSYQILMAILGSQNFQIECVIGSDMSFDIKLRFSRLIKAKTNKVYLGDNCKYLVNLTLIW